MKVLVLLTIGIVAAETKPPLPVPSNVFYSDLHWFRIVYPQDARRHYVRDEFPPKTFERETFELKAPDESTLYGRAGADARDEASSEEAVRKAIEVLKNGDSGHPNPPFNLTLKVIKKDWYAISGTVGDEVFYQKGLAGPSHRFVQMQYPVKSKQYFDPLVAKISNSLERYIYFRAKVLMPDTQEKEGMLWFLPEPGDAVNDRTLCYYSLADAGKFEKLKEGQTVTVGGTPERVILRELSEQQAGLYETSIKSCVLIDPK